jgi:hypothetical protein
MAEPGVKGGIMKEERAMAQVALARAAGRICLLGLTVQILLSTCAVAQPPQPSTNRVIARYNKVIRAEHSHTLATRLRAEAHVVELQATHPLSKSHD